MLDFLGFIATAALMVLAVNAVIIFMDVSQSAKPLPRRLCRSPSLHRSSWDSSVKVSSALGSKWCMPARASQRGQIGVSRSTRNHSK
jgi:hypothetical protein